MVGGEGLVIPVFGLVAIHGEVTPPACLSIFVLVEEATALGLVLVPVAARRRTPCFGGHRFTLLLNRQNPSTAFGIGEVASGWFVV